MDCKRHGSDIGVANATVTVADICSAHPLCISFHFNGIKIRHARKQIHRDKNNNKEKIKDIHCHCTKDYFQQIRKFFSSSCGLRCLCFFFV